MTQPLTLTRLSYLNLKRKPVRTFVLVLLVAILSFVLFGGSVLSFSMKNGLKSIESRFGADLIVVPLGYEAKQQSLLLTGEPSYFYFDKAIQDKLQNVQGISKLSTQFYLTSLNAACCSMPVQIIGFNPATDFSIQPWIHQELDGSLKEGGLIVGSDILLEDEQSIQLFESNYPIVAKLEKTGTGLDQSVFATNETIQELFSHAKDKGLQFLKETNPDASISSILIKVEEGYDIDQVATNIRRVTDGVQIIRTQNMITSITKSIGSFLTFLNVFKATSFLITLMIIAIIFSSSVHERKKEFATLRILGATQKKLAFIPLWESIYISIIGAFVGLVLAFLFVFPFQVFIGDSIGLPYIQPALLDILKMVLYVLVTSVAIGPLASAYSAVKISRVETYRTFREGE